MHNVVFLTGRYKSWTGSTWTAVRVGSTRIDLDQLGSNKKIKIK